MPCLPTKANSGATCPQALHSAHTHHCSHTESPLPRGSLHYRTSLSLSPGLLCYLTESHAHHQDLVTSTPTHVPTTEVTSLSHRCLCPPGLFTLLLNFVPGGVAAPSLSLLTALNGVTGWFSCAGEDTFCH